jgi:hypothetical protein
VNNKLKKSSNKLDFLNQKVDKLSFLDGKVTVEHNMYDLVGKGLISALDSKYSSNQKFFDKARFDVNINLDKGYGVGLSYSDKNYGLKLTKDF